jgi:hypothetical protein
MSISLTIPDALCVQEEAIVPVPLVYLSDLEKLQSVFLGCVIL